MNAFQLGKIVSAITPEAAKLSKAMSANARICPEMSGQNMQNDGTKPKQKDKDEGRSMLKRSGNPGAPGKDEKKDGNSESHPKQLPPRQMTAARLLLRGKSAAAVGRFLEVNERTVRRWLDDPRFVAEANALASPKKSSSISPNVRARIDVRKCPVLPGNVRTICRIGKTNPIG